MRGYEQPAQPITPREDLERERERIAAETAAFLAGGGTISHPGPRQVRAEAVEGRSSHNTRRYVVGAQPAAITPMELLNRAQRKRLKQGGADE